MRRGCVSRCLVAYDAVIRRREAAAVVAPGAVSLCPVSDMGARRGLVMAPDAVVLPVANKAPFAVPFRHEPVPPRTPVIGMVPRHGQAVTGYAILSVMADEA
jgi:hypothetical protein